MTSGVLGSSRSWMVAVPVLAVMLSSGCAVGTRDAQGRFTVFHDCLYQHSITYDRVSAVVSLQLTCDVEKYSYASVAEHVLGGVNSGWNIRSERATLVEESRGYPLVAELRVESSEAIRPTADRVSLEGGRARVTLTPTNPLHRFKSSGSGMTTAADHALRSSPPRPVSARMTIKFDDCFRGGILTSEGREFTPPDQRYKEAYRQIGGRECQPAIADVDVELIDVTEAFESILRTNTPTVSSVTVEVLDYDTHAPVRECVVRVHGEPPHVDWRAFFSDDRFIAEAEHRQPNYIDGTAELTTNRDGIAGPFVLASEFDYRLETVHANYNHFADSITGSRSTRHLRVFVSEVGQKVRVRMVEE